MSSNLKYSAALKNAQMAAITAALGANGLIRVYGGSQPASPDTAIGAQPLLAELDLSATAAAAPANGVWTASAIANGTGTAAASTGTNATFYRACTSAGVGIVDGSVGVTGADLNLNNINIATGQVVSVTSWTLTNPQ